ncbi:MAG TPA: 16S rRNA (guanine(527)-N(7))-methyltransferase RsmG [Actinomycetota bacterium]
MKRLDEYEELLRSRALPMGLIAASDAENLRERHIDDSLRATQAFREDDARCFDLGSGAGLPGIPLAIALPGREFVLIESRRRRAGFLELAIDLLKLENVRVLPDRVESVGERVRAGRTAPADLATARAFASLERSWRAAAPLLRPGGRLVYFGGRGLEDPVGAARSAGVDGEISVLDSSSPLVIMGRR